jgi:hypothetical protein
MRYLDFGYGSALAAAVAAVLALSAWMLHILLLRKNEPVR